ncbi:MAG: ADYC domain-containing protein [Dokdonella sp.]
MQKAITHVVALLFVIGALSASTMARSGSLSVDGTRFVFKTEDGKTLRGAELVGAELDMGDGSTIRIDAVRVDPLDTNGDTLLHTISVRMANGEWQNPCQAAADETREVFPIPGRWDADGRYRADADHFALSCTSGAQAKCVRFGYKPWRKAADGTSLVPLYESCVHMVRADYCGDGVPATRNGTLIDIFDDHAIQKSEKDSTLAFEAGWSPTGAVCVAHTRIAEEVDFAALVKRCPKLRDAVDKNCDETRARALGAVVFNRSR